MPLEEIAEDIDARHNARLELIETARVIRDRDPCIRRAAALGITRAEIARILGMARSHVSTIANTPEGP